LRIFFAIRIAGDLQRELSRAQRSLQGNWRCVRADHFHVTLAFWPHLEATQLPDLIQHGVSVARRHTPFPALLGGTGYFPAQGSPRVWFAKLDAPELGELAGALRDYPTPPEAAAFLPHITLARKKGPAPRPRPIYFGLGMRVRQYGLFQSKLGPTGPEYTQLAAFGLRPPKEAP
jgi:2'-5' RNA ligase